MTDSTGRLMLMQMLSILVPRLSPKMPVFLREAGQMIFNNPLPPLAPRVVRSVSSCTRGASQAVRNLIELLFVQEQECNSIVRLISAELSGVYPNTSLVTASMPTATRSQQTFLPAPHRRPPRSLDAKSAPRAHLPVADITQVRPNKFLLEHPSTKFPDKSFGPSDT